MKRTTKQVECDYVRNMNRDDGRFERTMLLYFIFALIVALSGWGLYLGWDDLMRIIQQWY